MYNILEKPRSGFRKSLLIKAMSSLLPSLLWKLHLETRKLKSRQHFRVKLWALLFMPNIHQLDRMLRLRSEELSKRLHSHLYQPPCTMPWQKATFLLQLSVHFGYVAQINKNDTAVQPLHLSVCSCRLIPNKIHHIMKKKNCSGELQTKGGPTWTQSVHATLRSKSFSCPCFACHSPEQFYPWWKTN